MYCVDEGVLFLSELKTNTTASGLMFNIYAYALRGTYNKNVAPLFIVAKDWKHPKCSLIGN